MAAASAQQPPSLPATDAAGAPGRRGVAACAAGLARADDAALEALYRARFDLVFAAARRFLGPAADESLALDVVQETFIRIIAPRARAALKRLATEADLDHWLTAVTRTAALDTLRTRKRRALREHAYSRSSRSTHVRAAPDDIAWLDARLAELETEDAAMLRLRAKGNTLNHIAAAFDLTVPATHGRIRRALARLARLRRESDNE